jgi:hypothetical protein
MHTPRRHALLIFLALVASVAAMPAVAGDRQFALQVANGQVPENMRVLRVTQGDSVRLRWSVDRPLVLHLHGYDIEKRVDPGAAVDMDFVARATGRFPIHVHPAAAAGNRPREETLLYVEVYPR